MADDDYGEEYQDTAIGGGGAPAPPWLDEPIYSDEQMYSPLGARWEGEPLGQGARGTYDGGRVMMDPIGGNEAFGADEVPDDVNTGMTMAEDEGMSVGEPYAYDDQGITMDDRPLGFTPEMKKWASIPADSRFAPPSGESGPPAPGKHYGAGLTYSEGYAGEKASQGGTKPRGVVDLPPTNLAPPKPGGYAPMAAPAPAGGGDGGGKGRGDEAWGFAYDKAIEAGATPDNAKMLADKARARADSSMGAAPTAVAAADTQTLSPADANKKYLQANGFYYPGHYLDSLDEALTTGEIDEATYNKFRDRYTDTSVGQARELFDLQLEDAREQAKQSALEGGEAVKMGEASEAAQTQNLADQKRIAREYEARRARLQAQAAQDETNMRKAIADYDKSEVDPNKHWSKATVGGRILAGISMALGAFGAALAHTPNYAMEIIENDINRDIAAQKANIEKKGQNVANQKGLVGFMYDKLGNLDAAEAAAKIQAFGSVKQQLELQAAKSQNVVLKGRAAVSMKMVDRRIKEAELEYKLKSTVAKEQWEAMQLKASMRGGGAKTPKSGEAWTLLNKEAGFYSAAAGGFFDTAEDRRDFANQYQDSIGVQGALMELKELSKRINIGDALMGRMSGPDAARARTLVEYTRKNVEAVFKQGVLREGERPAIEQALPDPSTMANAAIDGETLAASYDTLSTMVNTRLRAKSRALGAMPAVVSTRPRRKKDGSVDVDEYGNTIPVPMYRYEDIGDEEDAYREGSAQSAAKQSGSDIIDVPLKDSEGKVIKGEDGSPLTQKRRRDGKPMTEEDYKAPAAKKSKTKKREAH